MDNREYYKFSNDEELLVKRNYIEPKNYSEFCRVVEYYNSPKITNVIFNNPATIVFWSDNTKTVVKCVDGDEFDPEKGLAMAMLKKLLGDSYHREMKKWLPKTPEFSKEDIFGVSHLDETLNSMIKRMWFGGIYG